MAVGRVIELQLNYHISYFFFLISKRKYIKRTSRKQEANERVQRGTQTKRKHKRKQKANRAEKTKYNEEN